MTVPIIPEQWCFPHFRDGQVLTHNDLNHLRDFLYTRYAFQNRALFGFGVACGLRGNVLGNTTLEITGGFGLAPGGRELRYAAGVSLSISTIAAAPGVTYPFIDSSAGGFTPVLRAQETVTPAGGECTETGCDTHTELVCQDAEVIMVSGRLGLSGLAAHPAFALTPVQPAGTTVPGYASLQAALVTHLTPLLDAATLTLLDDLDLTGTPGTDLMKVGILNEILYSLWEYLRCTASQSLDCFGPTGVPALALGWLHQAGGNWSWDCTYRHHFELSPALYAAMRGQRCQDACRQALDHIRALLQSFEEPVIPTDPGDVVPPRDPPHYCRLEEILTGRCGPRLPFPIPFDPTKYFLDREIFTRWPPDRGWTDPLPPDVLRGTRELDPLGGGLIRITDMLGFEGAGAVEITEQLIDEVGQPPQVEALPVDDLAGVEGFVPGLTASPSDAIYYGVNELGAVVLTGSVPTSRTLREVSGALPAVREEVRNTRGVADEAHTMAGEARGLAQTADAGWRDLSREFADFRGAIPNADQIRQTWEFVRDWSTTRDGLVSGIDQARQDAINTLQVSLTNQFTTQLNQAVTNFGTQLTQVTSNINTQLNQILGQVGTASAEIAVLRDTTGRIATSQASLRGFMRNTLEATRTQLGDTSTAFRDMSRELERFERDLGGP